MAIKLFRCLKPKCQAREQGRFWGEEWKCPQCGLTDKDPRLGQYLVRLCIIHFDPPTDIPGVGLNVRACDKGKPIQAIQWENGTPSPWNGGTGSPSAVTCDKCMNTPEYIRAKKAIDDEEPVGVSEDGIRLPSATVAAFDRFQEATLAIAAAQRR